MTNRDTASQNETFQGLFFNPGTKIHKDNYMNMKTKIFYISEANLTEAIRCLYPGEIRPKGYEYLISIFIKRIFEKHDKKTYMITFELDSKHQESKKTLELTPDEAVIILRSYLEENTPVDFGLAPVDRNGNFEGYGYPFQVKRFIGHSNETFLNDLVKFIKDKSLHYSSSTTSLLIIPELSSPNKDKLKACIVGFSEDFFRAVANKININRNSLRSVLIFSLKNDNPELTQVWPNYGEY